MKKRQNPREVPQLRALSGSALKSPGPRPPDYVWRGNIVPTFAYKKWKKAQDEYSAAETSQRYSDRKKK